MKLVYHEDRDLLTNNLGVETRVPDWGGTSAFEELDPSVPFHLSAALRGTVEAMVGAGLQRNVTLRGAPYDFRYAPSSPVGARFIDDLRLLIEETFNATGSRVRLVSHSMGCLEVLYLLNGQPQAWKDHYIEKWVSLGGPWGGSAQELRVLVSGNNEGAPVDPLAIREAQRSFEADFWLAPDPRWWGERVLVSTPTRNYTAQDYDALFDDVGFPLGKRIRRRVADLTGELRAPGVELVCMYSLGVPTPQSFRYDARGFDVTPETLNGDGDGAVNAWSLQLCERWAEDSSLARPTRAVRFNSVRHAHMLTDPQVLSELLRELGLPTDPAVLELALPREHAPRASALPQRTPSEHAPPVLV